MKFIFSIIFFSFIIVFQIKAQKIQRKDAVQALNFIDSLIIPLKPAANNLVAYFQKANAHANTTNNYKLHKNRIDSLTQYYNALILVYDKAIKNATLNKTLNNFQSLKSNFLNLLTEGRKPWVKIIPVYIKMFKNGRTSLSISEQNLIDISGSIFNSSAQKALEWSNVVAAQEDEIAKKYNLQLYNDSYK